MTKLISPKVDQRIRIVRSLYCDNAQGGFEILAGAVGTVVYVRDNENDVVIGIKLDEDQATAKLTDNVKFFADETNSYQYDFYEDCSIVINDMDIDALLEFHLCCDFI